MDCDGVVPLVIGASVLADSLTPVFGVVGGTAVTLGIVAVTVVAVTTFIVDNGDTGAAVVCAHTLVLP
jgi:hypothetical protein